MFAGLLHGGTESVKENAFHTFLSCACDVDTQIVGWKICENYLSAYHATNHHVVLEQTRETCLIAESMRSKVRRRPAIWRRSTMDSWNSVDIYRGCAYAAKL